MPVVNPKCQIGWQEAIVKPLGLRIPTLANTKLNPPTLAITWQLNLNAYRMLSGARDKGEGNQGKWRMMSHRYIPPLSHDAYWASSPSVQDAN